MKYYEKEHEEGYQRIKAEGKTNWDELHGHCGFDDFAMRSIFEAALPQLKFAVAAPRALEYGCGTGPGACFLASRGFQTEGIDISELAIEMAKNIAAQRQLSIHYKVADICDLPVGEAVYDLVVDNFCLQCIVTDEDRAKVFATVASRLKVQDYYLIGTAIFSEDRSYEPQVFDDRTGIVYSRIEDEGSGFEATIKRVDGWYLPNRRHLKPQVLIDELREAGFTTLWYQEQGFNMGLICQRLK